MGIRERWRGFKPLPVDIGKRIEGLVPLFKEQGVLLAYLFGSLSGGKMGEDVDLAVLPEGEGLGNLREKVTEVLGTERVDLLNLKEASPTLRFEVVRTGRLVYKRDEEVENSFELSVLREYKDLAYLRERQRRILRQRVNMWLSGGK